MSLAKIATKKYTKSSRFGDHNDIANDTPGLASATDANKAANFYLPSSTYMTNSMKLCENGQ